MPQSCFVSVFFGLALDNVSQVLRGIFRPAQNNLTYLYPRHSQKSDTDLNAARPQRIAEGVKDTPSYYNKVSPPLTLPSLQTVPDPSHSATIRRASTLLSPCIPLDTPGQTPVPLVFPFCGCS
jgi:hypothetical protein